MPLCYVLFDPDQPQGSQFESPAVRAELGYLAPTFVAPGSVGPVQLAPGAVTNTALAAGAVTSDKIAASGVDSANLALACVESANIADGAVGPTQAGIGILTVVNSAGNPTTLQAMILSAAQYAAISSPSPNILYLITP